jgi:hypothetical protein
MDLEGTCRLVDVLGELGSHNTEWRWGPVRDVVEGVEMALTYYSPFVSKILAAEPVACFRALFRAADASQIVNYRTMQRLPDMAADLERNTGTSGEYVGRMAASDKAITGPLICTCQGDLVQGVLQPRSDFLLFDGFHRGAAWILQGKVGRAYPISARIIVTKGAARLGQGGA